MHSSPLLHVCSLADLPKTLKTFNPDAVISILDPGDTPIRHPYMPATQLTVGMVDNNHPNPHAADLLDKVLAFIAPLPPNTRILFHCVAGKSRSPALALIVASQSLGSQAAAQWLTTLLPTCRPNPWLLQAADDRLNLTPSLASLFPHSFPTR